MDRRFELVRDAPPPWKWEQYASWLDNSWPQFLESTDPSDEEPFRRFLATHPCLLPGGEGGDHSFGGHHGGWNDTVIVEPMIPGISRRFPDFMWLTKTSEEIIPVLIEIEAPGKPWFNQDGTRSSKLTQAQDQLAEWRAALDNPANRLQLGELYDFPRRWTLTHPLAPRYLLIYGRRSEFDQKPEASKKRQMIRGPATDAMTYDRLRPLPGSEDALSVQLVGNSTKVVSIPPTFRFGPGNAEALASHHGWQEAIQGNELIAPERKNFLLTRLSYWRELGGRAKRGESLGPYSWSDWE